MRPIPFAAPAFALLAVGVGNMPAGAVPPPARSRLIASGLNAPLFATYRPGDPGHVFVVERAGVIKAVNTATGAVGAPAFLDIRPQVNIAGDGGLLGLAFDPAYASNGFFYAYFDSTDDHGVLARFHAAPGSLIADFDDDPPRVWRYARPHVGHNAGWIGFSPVNGYLYLSSGDGATFVSPDPSNVAQTITNQLLGKMLRIDVSGDDFPADPDRNYRVPPSNPFVGAVGDDEIWSYGLRNPWRCSFDRTTGDLWIADVGEDAWEEIDMEPAASPGGRNYGWRCMEGNHCTGLGGCSVPCGDPALTGPLYEHDHSVGHSITGGYVYRGAAIPALAGLYFFADFVDNRIWSLRAAGGSVTEFQERTAELTPPGTGTPISNIAAFGEDAAGELYVLDHYGGLLYKIVPNPCRQDFNDDGHVTVQDIFDFLAAWFSHGPGADFNGFGGITVQDIFDFLAAWFVGCA